jgi:HAD superfamily hydrolase (TIGR01549 family)
LIHKSLANMTRHGYTRRSILRYWSGLHPQQWGETVLKHSVKGILFDMDGVIVRQSLDFMAIKQEIFGSTEGFILERMAGLRGATRARAEAILDRYETEAAERAVPVDGALDLLAWLEGRRIPRGIVTRNSRKSVAIVLEKLGITVDAVVTREDAAPKPSPEPILVACRRLGIAPAEGFFVGDFEFDMLAGRHAGITTVLLKNPVQPHSENADHVIESFRDLEALLSRNTSQEGRR